MEEEEPELYVFRPAGHGEEWRAERERRQAVSRELVLDRLTEALVGIDAMTDERRNRASAILDVLFVHRSIETGEPCSCSCHPRLPGDDLHDHGEACSCRRTRAERLAFWDEWKAKTEAYWLSPEGLAETARRQAEESELAAWVDADDGVVINQHGGMCPEQWQGSVDGHSFYFRERSDQWRIELDLQPSGRFVEVWIGGDLDDPNSTVPKELEEGTVIARGVTDHPDYGETPVERAAFLVGTIRTHLARQACRVHEDVEALRAWFGEIVTWCPSCGIRLPS